MNKPNRTQPQRRLAAGAALAGLLLTACGSATTTTSADTTGAAATATTATSDASATADASASGEEARLPLPAVNVFDVGTGSEVSLTSLADDGRPTLLWFYAPH